MRNQYGDHRSNNRERVEVGRITGGNGGGSHGRYQERDDDGRYASGNGGRGSQRDDTGRFDDDGGGAGRRGRFGLTRGGYDNDQMGVGGHEQGRGYGAGYGNDYGQGSGGGAYGFVTQGSQRDNQSSKPARS